MLNPLPTGTLTAPACRQSGEDQPKGIIFCAHHKKIFKTQHFLPEMQALLGSPLHFCLPGPSQLTCELKRRQLV